MWGDRRTPIICQVCGSPHIHASYRTDTIVYVECRHCLSVWPLEVELSETHLSTLLGRNKTERRKVPKA